MKAKMIIAIILITLVYTGCAVFFCSQDDVGYSWAKIVGKYGMTMVSCG